MDFNVSVLTRRGGRQKNEDRADHTQTESSAMFVLADGMGGHPDGEIAAEIAVRTMIELFHKEARSSFLQYPYEFLAKGLRTAHHRIIRYGTEQGLFDVPRTTAVTCIVQEDKIWWGNCGDSRLYLFRNNEILACTVDHSLIKGNEHAQEASNGEKAKINRNALYTCLGSMTLPVIDVTGPMFLVPGDRVFLCSDGLWSVLSQEKIIAVLGTASNIQEASVNLVESALLAAGAKSDNVTVIGIEWKPKLTSEKEKHGKATAEKTLQNVFADNKNLDTEIDAAIDEINAMLERMNRTD